VYFGTDYNAVRALAGPNVKVIFLQMCWDGADMFKSLKTDQAMWPIFYSIMNLPPSMRSIIHVGMHLAGFDLGGYASLDIFADELLQMWTTGFVVAGQRYKVFLIEILTDSRGREKLMKIQGAGSFAGCFKCDFKGITFAKTRVYNEWRRYLPIDDERRRISRGRDSLTQNFCHESGVYPTKISYETYACNGRRAMNGEGDPVAGGGFAYEGVKGTYSLDLEFLYYSLNVLIIFSICSYIIL